MKILAAMLSVLVICLGATTTAKAIGLPYKIDRSSLQTQARGQEKNLNWAMYVCHRGRGQPKRFACKAKNWINRELHETKAKLHPPFPPHHALWNCIHKGEANWGNRDTGHNGHYGGLQMHPGWGYGTSYYASDNSQSEQEWAAERGYRASGYSHSWLEGQWGQTIGPCWNYA